MNPQGDELAVLERFAGGPEQLERALAGLDGRELDATGSRGGWTIRQIVHHIVDGDDLWKLGIKTALGNEDGEFTLGWYGTLTQDEWAERWKYAERPVDVSLALFKATREHVQQLMKHVPNAWHRSIGVLTADGQTERVTVGAVLQMQADHAMHHIDQIVAIRAADGGT